MIGTLLQKRLRLAVDVAAGQPQVDASQVAAIGYCFGGLCVLDLARIGADVSGVVSFHGLFHPPGNTGGQPNRRQGAGAARLGRPTWPPRSRWWRWRPS